MLVNRKLLPLLKPLDVLNLNDSYGLQNVISVLLNNLFVGGMGQNQYLLKKRSFVQLSSDVLFH